MAGIHQTECRPRSILPAAGLRLRDTTLHRIKISRLTGLLALSLSLYAGALRRQEGAVSPPPQAGGLLLLVPLKEYDFPCMTAGSSRNVAADAT
jgi:hypothetical protein